MTNRMCCNMLGSNLLAIGGGYSEYKHCLIWRGPSPDEKRLTEAQARQLLYGSNAWMLQNLYDWDCDEETNFWFIIKESYSESDYSKKVRKYIEKANARFEYRLIDKVTYQRFAYDVYDAAFSHYKVNDGYRQTRADFEKSACKIDRDVDIWGAIDRETGRLEAYSICKRKGDIVDFQTSKANPEFLPKYYIMYGLYDARNRYYLGEKRFKIVISSARSITEHSNIQNFLIEKLGFRRAFCHMSIYYKPWLKFIVNCVYPLRKYIKHPKIVYLLRLEEMRRGKY